MPFVYVPKYFWFTKGDNVSMKTNVNSDSNTATHPKPGKPQVEKDLPQNGLVVRSQVRAGFSMGPIHAGLAKIQKALPNLRIW